MWRSGYVESVEKELEKFRHIVMKCTHDVCATRHVGAQRRKRSEWWIQEMGRAVAEKRRAVEIMVVKRAVQVAKIMADCMAMARAIGE